MSRSWSLKTNQDGIDCQAGVPGREAGGEGDLSDRALGGAHEGGLVGGELGLSQLVVLAGLLKEGQRRRDEKPMTILTKSHVLTVARRAYGADYAESLKERLPDRVDLEDGADTELLFQLGLTPDRLASALGGEL